MGLIYQYKKKKEMIPKEQNAKYVPWCACLVGKLFQHIGKQSAL